MHRDTCEITGPGGYPASGRDCTESSDVRAKPRPGSVAERESGRSTDPKSGFFGVKVPCSCGRLTLNVSTRADLSPQRADIAGDIRYLLVRASWGRRSCLGYEGRRGEVTR